MIKTILSKLKMLLTYILRLSNKDNELFAKYVHMIAKALKEESFKKAVKIDKIVDNFLLNLKSSKNVKNSWLKKIREDVLGLIDVNINLEGNWNRYGIDKKIDNIAYWLIDYYNREY